MIIRMSFRSLGDRRNPFYTQECREDNSEKTPLNRRVTKGESAISAQPSDEQSRAERFIETYLTFTKGQCAGKPFKLEEKLHNELLA
jgi:hypothetical protein